MVEGRHKLPSPRLLGLGKNCLRTCAFDNRPAFKEHHSMRYVGRQSQVMGGHQHGRSFAGQLSQHSHHLQSQFRIQRRGRLIAQ